MTLARAEPEHLRVALFAYRGNPRSGGQGVYVRYLTRELAVLGHDVTVFSGQPYPELDRRVRLVKVPSLDLYRDADAFRRPRLRELESTSDLLELATMWSGGFGEPRAFTRRVVAELRARRDEFDIVHDNQGLGHALVDLVGRGWPAIASIHHPVTIDRSLDLAAAPSRARRTTLRRWYGFSGMQIRVARRLDRIITVSESSARDIAREMGIEPERIAVIPIGVDTVAFRPLPQIDRVAGRIMTTTSSDVALKGLAVLIEALGKIRTERPDAHLVVVGQLRENGSSAEAIARLGLENAVTFVSSEQVARIVERYAEAEVAVVPSLYEGFSLPAIEAMASGVPLVATTGGALPEVVGTSGVTATLVAPGDPGALAAAILSVLGDPERAREMADAARRRVLERFNWQETARRTVEEYRGAIARARSC